MKSRCAKYSKPPADENGAGAGVRLRKSGKKSHITGLSMQSEWITGAPRRGPRLDAALY